MQSKIVPMMTVRLFNVYVKLGGGILNKNQSMEHACKCSHATDGGRDGCF